MADADAVLDGNRNFGILHVLGHRFFVASGAMRAVVGEETVAERWCQVDNAAAAAERLHLDG